MDERKQPTQEELERMKAELPEAVRALALLRLRLELAQKEAFVAKSAIEAEPVYKAFQAAQDGVKSFKAAVDEAKSRIVELAKPLMAGIQKGQTPHGAIIPKNTTFIEYEKDTVLWHVLDFEYKMFCALKSEYKPTFINVDWDAVETDAKSKMPRLEASLFKLSKRYVPNVASDLSEWIPIEDVPTVEQPAAVQKDDPLNPEHGPDWIDGGRPDSNDNGDVSGDDGIPF